MAIRAVLIALLASVALSAAASDVYRWTDAQGQVHYGSTPPVGQEAELVPIHDDRSTSTTGEPTPAAAFDDERSAHCETARHNLEVLENTAIKEFLDPDGKVVRYSDEERREMVEEARAQIAYFCR